MPSAAFWVSVNGQEITSTLELILISMTITDSDGGKSDTLEIELDDEGGAIEFPPTNAPIEAGIMYEDDDGVPTGPPVQFSGKVDKSTSELSRGSGLTMRISAKSADVKGKPKAHKEKHHDAGKLSAAAKAFAKEAGMTVTVAKGIDIERDYWSMQGESFLNWGMRTAQEIGATFKVRGNKAIFAERSAGKSPEGKDLPTILATRPGNIITGSMSPNDDRQEWSKFRVRYYDKKKAKYVYTDAEAKDKDGEVEHLNNFDASDETSAKARGKSNSTESERDKGGGTITINGETAAQSEAMCIVSGYRPAIDGTYRISVATHKLTRSDGYTTELTLKQPAGEAGKDNRGSEQ